MCGLQQNFWEKVDEYLFKRLKKHLNSVMETLANSVSCCGKVFSHMITCPVDTERKLNVHKKFRKRPERLLNVLCTFSLRPVSTGLMAGKKVNETSLPTKKEFYSNLTMESIADADHKHSKILCKDTGLQNLGQHHYLYLQCDTLLLEDVFETFKNKYLKSYELDPAYFLSAPRLTWQTA